MFKWLYRLFAPRPGDHIDLFVQRDFMTAVACVREVVAAAKRQSNHSLGYSVQCALNALSYGGYASLGDGRAPELRGPVNSKLTVFLRTILPILKKWIEKLLPGVFGMTPTPTLDPGDMILIESWLKMPD